MIGRHYNELVDLIRLINNSELKDELIGLNGSNWILEHDNNGKKKNFEIWSPGIDTEKRKLETFLTICKKILEISKYNPEIIVNK